MTVHGGKQFFSLDFIPTNIVVQAPTHPYTQFPDLSIAKVRKNMVFVSESASYGKDSKFHLLWSPELGKETIFKCSLVGLVWK